MFKWTHMRRRGLSPGCRNAVNTVVVSVTPSAGEQLVNDWNATRQSATSPPRCPVEPSLVDEATSQQPSVVSHLQRRRPAELLWRDGVWFSSSACSAGEDRTWKRQNPYATIFSPEFPAVRCCWCVSSLRACCQTWPSSRILQKSQK